MMPNKCNPRCTIWVDGEVYILLLRSDYELILHVAEQAALLSERMKKLARLDAEYYSLKQENERLRRERDRLLEEIKQLKIKHEREQLEKKTEDRNEEME